jgi:hypothetical protein
MTALTIFREDTAHEKKSDARQEPAGNEGASNAHQVVPVEPKAVAADEEARPPVSGRPRR